MPPQTTSGTAALQPAEAVQLESPTMSPRFDPHEEDSSQEPRLAPPQESAIPLVTEEPAESKPGALGRTFVRPGDAKSTSAPNTRSSQKPISVDGPPQASSRQSFPALAGLAPAEQTAGLAAALYAQTAREGRPTVPPQSLRLIDRARAVPGNERARIAEAFWIARQLGAQHQGLIRQVEWLDALAPPLSAESPPFSDGHVEAPCRPPGGRR